MNRLLLTLFAIACTFTAFAQLNGNGYYRVLNQASSRYITIQDNKGSIDMTTTKADMMAILTIRGFDKEVDDAASIIYIEKVGSQYNLKSQGTDSKTITGNRYLNLKPNGPTYQAYGSVSGVDIYLADGRSLSDPDTMSLVQNGDVAYRNWYIKPVNQADNQYFGLRPQLTVGGQRYTSLYASFPFNFYSSGMKAYIVTKVDAGMAVWQEWQGTVPGETPVIIAVGADDPSGNRLDIVDVNTSTPSSNLLKGVYFANGQPGESHFNKTPYDPNTMRLLGITSDGRLGFVKSTETYLPKNRAYLEVPTGSPDEIPLVSQAEYEAEMAKDDVVVTANSYTRLYGDPNPTFEYSTTGHELKGTPSLTCAAMQSSPVGTYEIVAGRGSVTNVEATFVNGSLTITRAPLTISAGNYTIKQNQPLPQFVATYSGFKVSDGEGSLSTLPILTTDAPADKTPGTYTVNVSGASATNYDISYVPGTLTILEADPITIKAFDAEMEYGDELPELTYTVTGGTLPGTPVLKCSATSTSDVGTYDITVDVSAINYPNIKTVAAKLTVTKAPVIVTAKSYTIDETAHELPAFEATYQGFKNGQDESVLTQQPTFTCGAQTSGIANGVYTIYVRDAQAQNYSFSYVTGTLTINRAPTITITAHHASMLYGDPLPELTYEVSGGTLTDEPVLTCPATSASNVGSYDITIDASGISYPRLKLVNAVLAIEKAPLKVFVGEYSRLVEEPNPEFKLVFEGFRNGDDESVLTELPVATTEATAESAPGEYVITVSGGEALNYYFVYVDGLLKVSVPDAIQTVYALEHPADVYTLSGRKVRTQATTLSGLPKGVYIVEGRKRVVR